LKTKLLSLVLFSMFVFGLFVVPSTALAASCQTETCVIKALMTYDRAVLTANRVLFNAVIQIGSKYLVPLAYGQPVQVEAAEADWNKAAQKFVAANQRAASRLLAKVPQEDAIHIILVDFESAAGVDFLYASADATAEFALSSFFIFP